MNYFDSKIAAERYNIGRPDFHSNTINRIKSLIGIEGKVNKALDTACGTGLSTKALLSIADNVYGSDYSTEMLNLAFKNDKISYVLAAAETQPFSDNEFDLITVSSGVHWFNINSFLHEVHRLLKSNSWLVLYENYFLSEMEGVEDFKEWFPEVYLQRYPSPPRNMGYDWGNENLRSLNLRFMEEEQFKNPIVFNKRQLVAYFTTQSNIISAVTSSKTTYEEVEIWLMEELNKFFKSEEAPQTIYFGNWIKYIQRTD